MDLLITVDIMVATVDIMVEEATDTVSMMDITQDLAEALRAEAHLAIDRAVDEDLHALVEENLQLLV